MIVPAVSGTNSSGPRSPTIDARPTGGLPPLAKPRKLVRLKPLRAFSNCLCRIKFAICLMTPTSASPNDLVPSMAAVMASTMPLRNALSNSSALRFCSSIFSFNASWFFFCCSSSFNRFSICCSLSYSISSCSRIFANSSSFRSGNCLFRLNLSIAN